MRLLFGEWLVIFLFHVIFSFLEIDFSASYQVNADFVLSECLYFRIQVLLW
jgi:hypothetical protein